jgi:hypothetical protein
MATIWESTRKATTNNTLSGTTLSSFSVSFWTRQQKLAMIAGFVILGLLLAVSACSKQSGKPAQTDVSNSASSSPTASAGGTPQVPAPQTTAAAAPKTVAKKAPKKRPANVTYSDANSGVSFVYPRKFTLATGDKAQPQFDSEAVPMNFVQPGGATVATIALPKSLYPGTDFTSAFFSVNVNHSLSEQECSHFAFVDTRNADGEPVDAEKVKVGSTDMEMTSEFAGSATRQAEAQYYHNYENGACYEYVLGLGTAGYGTAEDIKPVNRDEVFARLEKILATVKIHSAAPEQVAEQATVAADSSK